MSHIILYSDFKPGVSDIVDDALLGLMRGTACRVGYVPSDSDLKRRYFEKTRERYADVGIFDLLYFDLGEEFTTEKLPNLMDCDVIHLSGGNPETFLELVRKRNFTHQLKEFLKRGGILSGISAGAMILTPSLGLLSIDSKESSARKSSALKFVDFEFYPHYRHDERTTNALRLYAKSRGIRVYACNDDAGIHIKNGVVTPLGDVTRFDP